MQTGQSLPPKKSSNAGVSPHSGLALVPIRPDGTHNRAAAQPPAAATGQNPNSSFQKQAAPCAGQARPTCSLPLGPGESWAERFSDSRPPTLPSPCPRVSQRCLVIIEAAHANAGGPQRRLTHLPRPNGERGAQREGHPLLPPKNLVRETLPITHQ